MFDAQPRQAALTAIGHVADDLTAKLPDQLLPKEAHHLLGAKLPHTQ